MINKFDILAGRQGPVLILDGNILRAGLVFLQYFDRLTEFWHILIKRCVHGLPAIIDALNFCYLLVGQNRLLLFLALVDNNFLDIAVPPTQIHKEHFTAAVTNLPAVHGSSLFVHVYNPEGYGNIGGIEHIARKNDNCFHFIILKQSFPVLIFIGIV